jgi:hypothetical protein
VADIVALIIDTPLSVKVLLEYQPLEKIDYSSEMTMKVHTQMTGPGPLSLVAYTILQHL